MTFPPSMKNRMQRKTRRTMRLGELVAAVTSCASSETEAFAALTDLFARGTVRIRDHGHLKRIRLSLSPV